MTVIFISCCEKIVNLATWNVLHALRKLLSSCCGLDTVELLRNFGLQDLGLKDSI